MSSSSPLHPPTPAIERWPGEHAQQLWREQYQREQQRQQQREAADADDWFLSVHKMTEWQSQRRLEGIARASRRK